MEFRKQDLLHEIDVVWLSSLESSKLYASCMQCNAIFKSVIVLYFFRVANFNFNFLSHFCIDFENLCAHHREEVLRIPKHPQLVMFG